MVACTSKPFQSLLIIQLQSLFRVFSVCYSSTPLLTTKIYIRLDSLPEQNTGSEPSARDHMKPEFLPQRLCLQVPSVTLRASTYAFGRGHKHLTHNNDNLRYSSKIAQKLRKLLTRQVMNGGYCRLLDSGEFAIPLIMIYVFCILTVNMYLILVKVIS